MIKPPRNLIDDLKSRYAEGHRAYHTWGHIEALLQLFREHNALFDDPTRVLWALYWHDAIYDPTAVDNEAQSAELLQLDAKGFLTTERICETAQIIEATRRHMVPDDVAPALRGDMTRFLDMDLSILGQVGAVFDAYEAAVRVEYAFVEDTLFKHARAAVLTRFLERDRLYFNDIFADLWEQAARENLKRSIAALH